MSLVSITTSKLYAKLLELSDPEEVATWFVGAFANNSIDSNVQLIDLIFRCCGVSQFVRVPRKIAKNEDIDQIVSLVENETSGKANKFTFDKCANKALKFFERFWSLTWCNRDDADDEPPFVWRLLRALTETELHNVQFFCVRILSKSITSILEHKPNNFEKYMAQLYNCARAVMYSSLYHKDRKLLKLSLLEFERWFNLRPGNFSKDDCLCFVVWSLKDSAAIMTTGLEILERLLSDGNFEILPEKFVHACCQSLSNADLTHTDEIFARVCGCCVKVRRSNYRNLIPRDFEKKLIDHLYSIDENKWKAAADYWVAVNYDVDPFQYLRNVIEAAINSSPSESLKRVEYFVDSLIDKCDVLTRWNLLAELLLDEYPDKQLTVEEKKVLLVLIMCAAQRVVTKKKPRLRTKEAEDEEVNESASENITLAFLPRLEQIFNLEFVDPIPVLKLVTFLNFKSVPSAKIKMLIRSCELTFQNMADNFLVRRVVLELLCKMERDCGDDDLRETCMSYLERLKEHYETRVRMTFDDFLRVNSEAEGVKLSEDLFGLRIINAVLPVARDVAYDCALKLLKEDLPPVLTSTFMAVREMCVVLSATYIVRNLRDETSEKEKFIKDAGLLAIYFSIQLLQPTGGNRGGVAIFHGLCDLAPWLDSERLPLSKVKTSMRQYFVLALSKPNNEHQRPLMDKYLKAIDLNFLPMEYAYSALIVHCNQEEYKYEKELQRFLAAQCEKRGGVTMAKWMMTLWIRVYESEFATQKDKVLKFCEKLYQLVHGVRSKLNFFVYECHIAGIDYVSSDPVKCSEFAQMLSIFSMCLSPSDKGRALKYALTKSIQCTRAVNTYIKSLEVGALRLSTKIEEHSARGTSSFEEASSMISVGWDSSVADKHDHSDRIVPSNASSSESMNNSSSSPMDIETSRYSSLNLSS